MGSDDVPRAQTTAGRARVMTPAIRLALGRVDPPIVVLIAAAILTIAAAIAALLGGTYALFFDDLQELVAAGGGAAALAVAARRRVGPARRQDRALAVSLGGAWLGMLAWDFSHPLGSWLTTVGDLIFVASVGVGVGAVVYSIFRGIQRDRLLGIAIDTLILCLAGIAVVAALWSASVVAPGDRTASIGAVVLIATSAGCAFGLIARRVGRSSPGPWVLLGGGVILGASWLMWIGHPSAPSSVDLSDFTFSAGVLLIAQGSITWTIHPSGDPAFESFATVFNSLLPVGAILGSLALLALVHGSQVDDLLGLATSAVIVTAAARQLHLYSREARAHAALEARTAELQSAIAALELEVGERRRLEAERETIAERMLQSQRLESIGRLAGGVAHDFNNLLTAIRGYADLAGLRLPPDDEGQADLGAIRHASDQAASLTRQLLAFSRNQQLRPSVVDLGDVVSGTEPLLRRLLGERISLVVQTAGDLWPVLVDPSQFESIIVNLAVNARDAMEDRGRLTIETANVELDDAYAQTHAEVVPGPYAMLAVSDTGVGMDSAVLAHIFEPFFTTKGPGKGTGLGLATVYGTVRQSGGHISVYSEPGRGTTFKIYQPRTESVAVVEDTNGVAARPRSGHETILVAEDEDTVRDMIVSALQRQGYTTLAVHTGEEALRAIELHPAEIGILLTDVVMPGISGIELIAQARLQRPALRAICMSGYTPLQLSRGANPDDVTFLSKPFTLTRLEEVIRHVLDS